MGYQVTHMWVSLWLSGNIIATSIRYPQLFDAVFTLLRRKKVRYACASPYTRRYALDGSMQSRDFNYFGSWRSLSQHLDSWINPRPTTRQIDAWLRDAKEQSRIEQEGRNTRWLENTGVQQMLRTNAELLKNEKRALGDDLLLIHVFGVAQDMANCETLLKKGHSAPYLAMRGGTHDLGEDAEERKKDPHKIILQSVSQWRPIYYSESRQSIIESAWNMKDEPGLRGQARLDAQRERSRTLDEVDGHVRFHDKLRNYSEDRHNILNGHATHKQIAHSAKKAKAKLPIVEVLPVPEERKNEYRQLVAELEDLAQRPKGTGQKPVLAAARV